MATIGGLRVMMCAALALGLTSAPATATSEGTTRVVDAGDQQCGGATYESIQAAVDDSVPGDTIHVCPGIYGAVTVNVAVTIKGDPNAIEALNCFEEPTTLDPAVHAIVDGTTATQPAVGIFIAVSGTRIQGLAVRGWDVGIRTSAVAAGYRIDHNLVELNRLGIDVRSGGAPADELALTRVDHNCVRRNPPAIVSGQLAGGIVSEPDGTVATNLWNARIDHNLTFRNAEGIVFVNNGTKDRVVIDHNVLIETAVPPAVSSLLPLGIGIADSTRSRITDNAISGARMGVYVLAGNIGLEISSNTVADGRNGTQSIGILFRPPAAGGSTTGVPTTDAHVFGNTIAGVSDGIVAAPGPSLLDSLVAGNVSNGADGEAGLGQGIRITAGNNKLVVLGNETNDNRQYGIYNAGADNDFISNVMLRNGVRDAHDDAFASSDWIDNICETDNQGGNICLTP